MTKISAANAADDDTEKLYICLTSISRRRDSENGKHSIYVIGVSIGQAEVKNPTRDQMPVCFISISRGGCVRSMVLGNLQCRSVLLIEIIVKQGPTVFAVGWVGLFGHFSLPYLFFLTPLSRRRLNK